jgi:hypothetical protein
MRSGTHASRTLLHTIRIRLASPAAKLDLAIVVRQRVTGREGAEWVPKKAADRKPKESTTDGALLSEHASRPTTEGGQEDAERTCGSRSNSS